MASKTARRAFSKIRRNLFRAFVYNSLGLPLAVPGLLGPAMAGAAMVFSSFCMVSVSNALLLRRWHPQTTGE